MTQTALILGPTGRFGRNAELAFRTAGWATRSFDRSKHVLAQEVRGADVIVYGWNPEYPFWEAYAVKALQTVLDCIQGSKTTLLFPGNVYNFGAGSGPELSDNTPFRADNGLGKIRREMEQMLAQADVQTIVLRGGDFLDTRASGNWYDMAIMKHSCLGRMYYPGNPDIPHAWAYLPDFARAFVALAEKRDTLERHVSVNFPGYDHSGQQIADMLGLTLRRFGWWQVHLGRLFMPIAPFLLEMRYLWSMPHRLVSAEFDRLLPGFEHTPPAQAFATAASLDIHPDKPVIRGARLA